VAGRQAGLRGAHEVLAQTVEVGRITGVAGEALGGVDKGGRVAEFDPDAGGGFGRRRGRQGGSGEEGEEEKRRGHSRNDAVWRTLVPLSPRQRGKVAMAR
jgi:hypothetical protein